jgi:uncharacterized membrane protein
MKSMKMSARARDFVLRSMLVAVCSASMVGPAVAAPAQDSGQKQVSLETQQQINTLCQQIRSAIVKLPKDVSIEDAEAAIVFALSQSNPPLTIVDPALTCAAAGGVSPNVAQAIENVRKSYGRTKGTGAINRGGFSANGGDSFFSPPVVGIGGGGGGSNYTQR